MGRRTSSSLCRWGAAVAMLGATSGFAEPSVVTPCPRLEITSDEALALTPMEVRLLCGDPANPPWEHIPEAEASALLRSFLQSRGFFHATSRRRGADFAVETGAPTLVRAIAAVGAPPELDVSRFRPAPRAKLTPAFLDGIETWTLEELRANGYACPKVSSHGDPDTGDVTLRVASGPRQALIAVTEESLPDRDAKYLRRNDAFRIGDTFDQRLVILTQRRTMARELLVNTTLDATCGASGVTLAQRSIPGQPASSNLGFGLNSEELFLVRASYRYNHLDPEASAVDASATATRLEQELTASGQWYVLSQPSRFFLLPTLSLSRDDESKFETRQALIRVAAAGSYDGMGVGLTGSVGPEAAVVRTVRGPVAPAIAHVAALYAEARLMSHDYEFYQADPRQGFQLGVNDTYSAKAAGSAFDAQVIRATGEALWNVAALAPPMLVVGLRGGLGVVATGTSAAALADLPPNYRLYLGGEASVRGFARQSLPAGDQGALSMAYAGLELRLADIFGPKIQPLVFTDLGETDRQPLKLAAPLYWAPGAGVRWRSPLGPLRLSLAHGFVAGSASARAAAGERWNVYGSFGEEF